VVAVVCRQVAKALQGTGFLPGRPPQKSWAIDAQNDDSTIFLR
jgi:hypothetical protein